MRSSKSRSRSKSNRPRSLGNIVNRVFDSSGPEGKVRGTPQQIIEKYLVLARDAQLSNDRVAAENFLQHAEHYTRMLQEAQREMAREAEARRDGGGSFGGQHQAPGGGERETRHDGRTDGRGDGRHELRQDGRGQGQRGRGPDGQGVQSAEPGDTGGRSPEPAAVIDFPEAEAGHLVETPESRDAAPAGARTARDRHAPAPEQSGPAAGSAETAAEEAGREEAGREEAPRRRAPRRPRGPRKAETAETVEAKSSAAE